MTEQMSIGVLMFIAGRSIETRVMEALHNAGVDDITPAQGRLAARIGPDGTRLSELAEQALISKQTATSLVDKLENAGYVERVPDPADGRARLVRFTAKGEALFPLAREVEAQIEREWAAHLGRRRMQELRETMTRLREITDPYQAN
jgi:DNA-binding MarR family transcriptional regulator